MIEFYALPNSGIFWSWPKLVHYTLVALAGGAALLTAIAALRNDPKLRTYAILAIVLIALDMLVLWAGSPSALRFTHIWLFLSFNPQSAIWLGSWGLVISALLCLLLALNLGPRRVWGSVLLISATMTLLYPGLMMAVNINRPLWTPLLLAFFPVTGLLITLGLAVMLRQRWLAPWLVGLSLSSAMLGIIYLADLALGHTEAREALVHFWRLAGPLFALGLALLLASPVLIKRLPLIAGLLPIIGAVLTRSLIIDIGQFQPFGF